MKLNLNCPSLTTTAFISLLCLPGMAFSATLGARSPSGIRIHHPKLLLALSPDDDGDTQWSCGSCAKEVRTPSKMNALVNRFARYDALFESVINNATHHGPGAGYNLRFKLYF